MNPIRVLVADDHAIVREGIRLLFEAYQDLEIVGAVADGLSLWETIRRQHQSIDVLLLDLNMPNFERAVRQVAQLRVEAPDVAILILSAHREIELVQALLDAGASGYIPKTALTETLAMRTRIGFMAKRRGKRGRSQHHN